MTFINEINDILWTYILIIMLLGCAVWFSIRTRFVQFRMIREMIVLLSESAGKGKQGEKHVSSFQAFAISIASRVGTGNLAGVATAIAIGGPGAIFWMWVIALLGASSAFIESTLGQLYKIRGKDSFIGGPAYYMKKGLKQPWRIAAQIKTLHEAGTPYRDMAILYRAHYITRGVEEILLKEKIPYTIYSGVQFFARAEIKDALSYLRMIACRDDLSFLRIANVPKRNLGERRMAFLKDYAAQNGCSLYDALRRNLDSELLRGTKGVKFVSLIESFTGIYDQMPVSELLAAVLNESGYEAMLRTEGSQMRLDNLAELKQSVYTYETTCGEECTLEHYLAHVAMFTSADLNDPRDQIRLMTVHSAKGLEFPHVFLCAMNEGVFPSRKTRTLPGMEEERRLCFVAMTRAQKALYLSEAEGRNLDGSPRYPSRFLLDIDEQLLTFTRTPREELIRQAREYISFSSRFLDEASLPDAFAPGTRVHHAVFGDGTVLEVDPVQKAQLIQFDSMPTPRAISMRAKLERL